MINTYIEALSLIEKFIACHPEYSVDNLHFRQGTNSFCFQGRLGDEIILYKVSIRGSTAREAKNLRYFESSKLVPRFFHAEDNFVIEEFIYGDLWTEQIRLGEGASPDLLNSVGEAFVQFTKEAIAYPGLEAATFVNNLSVTLETAKLLLQYHSDAYEDDIFAQSLATVVEYRDYFATEPPMLYNYDCGPDNILLNHNRFARFVDLEGCYQGTLSLHIGAFFERLAQAFGSFYDPPSVIAYFRKMLAPILPSNEKVLLAAALLKVWLPIVRYHGWNGWQTWTPGNLPHSLDIEREHASVFAKRLHQVQTALNSITT